ncbi:Pseudouridine-5'-phosphate glycosidase [Streptomyces avidinii]
MSQHRADAPLPGGPVLSAEVREALARGKPVVALESTIIAHGLPRPRNLAVGLELEALVRAEGAVPATVAVLDGVPYAGLDKEQLERIAAGDGVRKLGHRDLAPALAAGATGATTVSATAFLAARRAGSSPWAGYGRSAPGADRRARTRPRPDSWRRSGCSDSWTPWRGRAYCCRTGRGPAAGRAARADGRGAGGGGAQPAGAAGGG